MISDKRLKEMGLLFKLQQIYRRKMPSRFLSEVEKRKYLHSLWTRIEGQTVTSDAARKTDLNKQENI